MKVVILAGGLGTRLSEETALKPKPMVEIGGMPIIWHIMKTYAHYGHNEFIVCCGYKANVIKDYFKNYFLHNSDVTFSLSDNSVEVHNKYAEAWRVTLVDTGHDTQTGGRLKRVSNYLDDQPFCFTYGDGVGNININELISFHLQHGRQATLTATRPKGRYGVIEFNHNSDAVASFREKPEGDTSWINGGFFVLEPRVIERIEADHVSWEEEPLTSLARDGELMAFRHDNFWQPMDTLRDKIYLDKLWSEGNAPWKIWS